MFIKYPHRLTGLGKHDNVDYVEKFVCLLLGLEKMLSKILITPAVVFCERETCHRNGASIP